MYAPGLVLRKVDRLMQTAGFCCITRSCWQRTRQRDYCWPHHRTAPVLAAGYLAANSLSSRNATTINAFTIAGWKRILLTEDGSLKRPDKFTFWARWVRQIGNFVEKHPALAEFPHAGYCSYQFYRLFGESVDAVDLTWGGSVERNKFAPIVWGMRTDFDTLSKLEWSNPENRWRMYWSGIVCEGRVGNGKLLACSLRVLSGLRNSYPEAGYLLDCLMDYALSKKFASGRESITNEEASEVFSDARM